MDVVSYSKAYQKVCNDAISTDTLSDDMVHGSIGAMDIVKLARLTNLREILEHRFNGVIAGFCVFIKKSISNSIDSSAYRLICFTPSQQNTAATSLTTH